MSLTKTRVHTIICPYLADYRRSVLAKLYLKKQLYLVYIVSIFIPIALIGYYLVFNTHNLIYNHYDEMLKSDNVRVRSILFETTTSVLNVCDSISDDPKLQLLLGTSYESWDAAQDALIQYNTIDNIYGRYTNINQIQLYTENSTLHNYRHIVTVDEAIHEEEWFIQGMGTVGYTWSTQLIEPSLGDPTQVLMLTHKIPIIGSDEDALLVITISNNYLKNRIDNNSLTVDLSVGNDLIFYSNGGHIGMEPIYPINYDVPYFTYSGVNNYEGQEAMIEISAFRPIKGEDYLYITSVNPQAIHDINRISWITSLIVLISIILPLIIIVKFTKVLTTRVDTLRKQMHRVSGGNYNIIDTFKGNDELTELFADLKIMIQSIKDRDEEIYKNQIARQALINHQQKIELELLSSKINPHFLYNTLETIRMKAFSVNDREVAHAVKLLGKYMRYNLESTGKLTVLRSELTFIETYLDIQKLRFAGRVDYDIEIDDHVDVDRYRILPLILQPVIENALLHGLEQVLEGGHIWIKIIKEEERSTLIIKVIDNGEGIEEQRLAEIKESLIQTDEHSVEHIGLYNIHQRIRLFYGEDYGLYIDGIEGEGTTVTIELPVNVEVEDI